MGILVLAFGGCAYHNWAPGPSARGDFGSISGQCKLMALNGGQVGGFVAASGSPKFVASYTAGAAIGAGIGSAVRTNQIYNACMEASGFVTVDQPAGAPQRSASPAAWPPIAATQPVAPVPSQPVAQLAPATFPAAPTPVPTSPQPFAPAAPPPSLPPVAAAPPSTSAAPAAAPDIISNPTAVPSSETYDYQAAKRQYEQAEQLYQSQLRASAGQKPVTTTVTPVQAATPPQPVAPAAPTPSPPPVAAVPPSTNTASPAPVVSNPTAVPSSEGYDYEQAKRQYDQAVQLYQGKL